MFAPAPLVMHNKLGLGKIIALKGDRAYVYVKDFVSNDEKRVVESRIKTFLLMLKDLTASDSSFDEVLSNLPPFTEGKDGHYYLTGPRVRMSELMERFLQIFHWDLLIRPILATKNLGSASIRTLLMKRM